MPADPTGKWSRRPEPAGPPSRFWWLLLLLAALGSGYLALRPAEPLRVHQTTPIPLQPQRQVTLFFATLDGSGLGQEIRSLPPCRDEATCLQETLAALSAGPGPGLAPILPTGSRLNGVALEDGTAIIDLERTTVQRLRGGALNELLCLSGLANTLTVNFPHIRQLAILVDGVAVPTLTGHVDLREPFTANFGLVRENGTPSTTH